MVEELRIETSMVQKSSILAKVAESWCLTPLQLPDLVLSHSWKWLPCAKVFWEDNLVCNGLGPPESHAIKLYQHLKSSVWAQMAGSFMHPQTTEWHLLLCGTCFHTRPSHPANMFKTQYQVRDCILYLPNLGMCFGLLPFAQTLKNQSPIPGSLCPLFECPVFIYL